ncbi:MAG: Cell shape-determining protein MreC [Pseudomonadota bacterium]|jgi:rod shape-determining protein MreC
MARQPPPFFNRGPTPLTRLVFFLAICIALMIADHRLHLLSSLRQSLSVLVYPLQQFAQSPVRLVTRASNFFTDQTQLQKENAELKQKLLEQSATAQSAQWIQAEHAQLLALNGAKSRYAGKGEIVEVLYTGRNPFARKIIVNKGSNDNIRQGFAVIDGKGVVGQVTAISPFTSEITLLTEKGHAVPVAIQRNGIRAIVFGNGRDGSLDLPYMADRADVRSGDLLVTSGIDGTYPPGLAVAEVTAIEHNSAQVFTKITCAPVAGVENHKYLLVLLSSPQIDLPKQEASPGDSAAKEKTVRKKRGAR